MPAGRKEHLHGRRVVPPRLAQATDQARRARVVAPAQHGSLEAIDAIVGDDV